MKLKDCIKKIIKISNLLSFKLDIEKSDIYLFNCYLTKDYNKN